jgi:type I restriction enzyme R subunit
MLFISEADVEALLLHQFEELGYATSTDSIIGPDGTAPEREAYADIILVKRLSAAIARLNPDIPAEARDDALRKIVATEMPSLVEENRRLHKLMTDGVGVEFYEIDGTIRGDTVRLIDFDDPASNDWLAVGQLTVIEGEYHRRPDIVIFVNGLALGVIELKNPGGEGATLTGAYNQLQTYKIQIPNLFRTNALLVTSDGLTARAGSLTADQERFMPWRTTDGAVVLAKGQPELRTLIEGIFDKARFLDLLRDFTVFGETDNGLAKIIAGYHQFHAVKHAVTSTVRALAINTGAMPAGPGMAEDPADFGLPGIHGYPKGDKRIGVIWHTQGSGKSLLMAFYAGQLVRHPALENPTIVVVTDRNDLDEQLFNTFSMCRDLIRQTPIRVDSREDLQHELNRASGGVIFTTIQKFSPHAGGGCLSHAVRPGEYRRHRR